MKAINDKKTKEMVIDFSKIKQEIPALTLNNTEIDQGTYCQAAGCVD